MTTAQRCAQVTLMLAMVLAGEPTRAGASFDETIVDDAVVQRGAPWLLSGRSDSAAPVTLRLGARRFEAHPRGGRWSVEVPIPGDAGGWLEISIDGGESRRVLAGDVWLCAGQSNMAMAVAKADDGGAIAQGLEALPIRLRKLLPPTRQAAAVLQPWVRAGSGSARAFSAVCSAYGKALQRRLGVPVGLIDASIGGTRIEAWISAERLPLEFARDDTYLRQLQPEDRQSGHGFDKNQASGLSDAMIEPLTGTPIRGVLWYQGESNRLTAARYAELLGLLMSDWRARWRNEQLPFVVIQLPGFGSPDRAFDPLSPTAAVREAQGVAVARDGHAVAVSTLDLGDVDLHPRRKLPVGERAAQAADRSLYARTAPPVAATKLVPSINGSAISVDLRPVSTCVKAIGPLTGSVHIAAVDRQWYPAVTEFSGLILTARAAQVPQPMALRYAWADRPPVPLRDCAREQSLPAFRTDDWPVTRPLRPGTS